MKPFLIDKKSLIKNSIAVNELKGLCFETPFHFHNVFEIVLVLKGEGCRIVGDKIENFVADDLVLLGPGLPHVWYNDKNYLAEGKGVNATVLHFNPDWLSENILKAEEFNVLTSLFQKIDRGIKLKGKLRNEVARLIGELKEAHGLKRVILLLTIFEAIGKNDNSYECLASEGYINMFNRNDISRIHKVYEFVMSNYDKNISLQQIATIANMTPTAFCKYFKSKTKKTFSDFVNEVRIGKACELLLDDQLSISEVCYESGFTTVNNFNKKFKEVIKLNPTQYRNNLKRPYYPKFA